MTILALLLLLLVVCIIWWFVVNWMFKDYIKCKESRGELIPGTYKSLFKNRRKNESK